MSNKYRPANGHEGMIFHAMFCEHCVHEKFLHTGDHADKKCDILSRSLTLSLNDDRYPSELTYNDEGYPICTSHQYYHWQENEAGLFDDPILRYPEDPRQLKIGFEYDPKTGDIII